MNVSNTKLLLATLIAAAITGCGGAPTDETGGTDTQNQATVIEAVGEIDGFGSVIVNGEHYETDDAEVEVDGEAGTEDDLEVGMIVEVEGEEGSDGKKKARKIHFRSRAAGTIKSIDVEARSFVIYKKSILIDDDTKLDEAIDEVTLAPLAEGVKVRVSGYRNADGDIVATRIDLRDGEKPARMHGEISSVDPVAKTFVIGEQTVDYSGAEIKGTEEDLVDGLKVMVYGQVEDEVLVASGVKVLVKKERPVKPKRVALKGQIKIDEEGNVTLNDRVLVGLDEAEIINGEAHELENDVRVSVKGTLSENGEIVVKVLKFEMATVFRLMGEVEAVDTEAATITVKEKVISITDDTDFVDRGHGKVRRFSIDDLAIGDKVSVGGYVDKNETAVAKRVTRIAADKMKQRRGRIHDTIDSVDGDTLVTSDGLTVKVTEETKIAESLDLAMITLGEDGDKLAIMGVYEDENTLVAKYITTLNFRPKKDREPRNRKDHDSKMKDIEKRIKAIETKMEKPNAMTEEDEKDVEGRLKDLKDRIAERKSKMSEEKRKHIHERCRKLKEKLAKRRAMRPKSKENMQARIDALIAKLEESGKLEELMIDLEALKAKLENRDQLTDEEKAALREEIKAIKEAIGLKREKLEPEDRAALKAQLDELYKQLKENSQGDMDPALREELVAQIKAIKEQLYPHHKSGRPHFPKRDKHKNKMPPEEGGTEEAMS